MRWANACRILNSIIMELLQLNLRRFKLHINWEPIVIVLFIAAFLLFPYLIRKVDFSAAPIDAGILSAIILALGSVLIFQAVTWWIIRIIWPVFYFYSTYHFENNFKSLESWQKVIIYLGFYCFLLLGFILVLGAIL
jgi:hypothetical protein